MRNVELFEREGRKALATKNFVRGSQVYGERLVKIDGEEYRIWDAFRSKLAAAILRGLPDDVFEPGQRVLYLGTSTGTTASHVSDIIGIGGLLIGVEFAPRVAREFIERVAKLRKNVLPYVADARDPSSYDTLGRVDIVYCDIAQQDQTDIAIQNCKSHLKKKGKLLLVVKSRSIDVLKEPKQVVEEERLKLERAGFRISSIIDLRPYHKDHSMILASLT